MWLLPSKCFIHLGFLLNVRFVTVEASYGVISGSLALITDAGHNLSNVLGLLLAWGAIWLAHQHNENCTDGSLNTGQLPTLAVNG